MIEYITLRKNLERGEQIRMKFDAKKKHLSMSRLIRKLLTRYIVIFLIMGSFSLILVASASGKSNAAENSNAGDNSKDNAADTSNAGGNSNTAENSNAGDKDDSDFWDWLSHVYNDDDIKINESDNPSNEPNKKENKVTPKNSEETGIHYIEFNAATNLKKVKVNIIKLISEQKEIACKPFSKLLFSFQFFFTLPSLIV